MILSFNPVVVADENLICAGRDPGPEELAAIGRARAVILPTGAREALFRMARENAAHVFPDYSTRFDYPGKTGQARLFQLHGAPAPETRIFQTVARWEDGLPGSAPAYPFIIKADLGGEGESLFKVNGPEDLDQALARARSWEASGLGGLVVQEFIETDGRSVRAVILFDQCLAYWRVPPRGTEILGGTAKGAAIDHDSDPGLLDLAAKTALAFAKRAGIDLAGLDLIFPKQAPEPAPLFLEINYFFGRKGLGGSDNYYKLLNGATNRWLQTLPEKG